MSFREGTVVFGINRIYTVDLGGVTVQCRLKGKILDSGVREYNPLAPGDRVSVQPTHPGEGLILARSERRNRFWRWNRKGRAVQTMAANLARVCCVASPQSPPFRPRFIDRVLVVAMTEAIPSTVVLNKIDSKDAGEADRQIDERLSWFREVGVPVLYCSARTGDGMDAVRRLAADGPCALVGQSGVGKSSLLNALEPSLSLRTGDVSAKHNRGTHVTNYGRLIETECNVFIDTPGIREIDLYPLTKAEVVAGFPEFGDLRCEYAACTHTHEPGCGVKAAAESGRIHPDRYESYVRILADLELSARLAHR